MITFIAYASVVSLLLVAAATASEPLLRAIRQPTRSVWLAAVLGAAIAIVSLWAPHSSARSAAIGANTNGVRETGTTSVMPRLARDGLPLERRSSDAPVLARGTAPTSIRKAAAPRRGTLVAAGCWLVASFGCLAWLLDGMRRVRLLRRSCRAGLLCGERVLVSDSVGPAVLGVLRQWIVIPAWVEQLDEDARRLILAHECEHTRARDPLALHAVMLLVALMPWNIAFWFALHRLHAAIEIDCDARVLRRERLPTRDYCRLLLEVGERTARPSSPLLALAEPATLLERRIELMTTSRNLWDWKTLMAATGAVMLLVGACAAPRPEMTPIAWSGRMPHALARATATPNATTLPDAAPVPHTAQPSLPAATEQASMASALGPRRSSRTRITPTVLVASPAGAQFMDTTVRNEDALRRSAAEHQARIDAIADSVILASYPELTRRPPGTPAFLALVLDDRKRVIRHAISLEPVLPNDLAAIMLALHVDTISARTIGLGISDDNRWNVTVGHAVEALGHARGRTEMRASMTAARPYSLYRVPYTRITDSVARARNPEAFQEHEGTFAIAMLLDEAGRLVRYVADPHPEHQGQSEAWSAVMKRFLADSSGAEDIVGMNAHLVPSRTVIAWRVRR